MLQNLMHACNMQYYDGGYGRDRVSIAPSMPMAAPKAIHMACSLGRVPPRVLLRRAPAAEPATAPRKPMARVQVPAKAHQRVSHVLRVLLRLDVAGASDESALCETST